MLFLLFGFWILMNGQWTSEIAITGGVICVALYLFMLCFMDYSPKKEWAFIRHIAKGIVYLAWLIGEIFRSAMGVIHFIWSPKEIVESVLVSFTPGIENEPQRVLLADSITLTPGTVTVSMHDGKYLVHALDSSMAEGIGESDMVKRVRKLERSKKHA